MQRLVNSTCNILFIDHSFHQKTKSSQFFIDILRTMGDVAITYDHFWEGGPSVAKDQILMPHWDLFIYWQILPNDEQLSFLPLHKTILVPMYDNNDTAPLSFWLKYIDCKILSFSTTIYNSLKSFGFDVFCLQYFPEPVLNISSTLYNKRKAFFWERTDFLNSSMVIDFLRPHRDFLLHIHQAPDPGHTSTLVDEKELQSRNIKLSRWFETKAELQSVVEDCTVYFAPRRLEGIGMSFLEAMARGKVVIAQNQPTMSEYIVSGLNGILVDWRNKPRMPEDVNFEKIGRTAAQSIAEGHMRYTESIPRLLEWLPLPTVIRTGLFAFKRICYRMALGTNNFIKSTIRFPVRVIKRLSRFKDS